MVRAALSPRSVPAAFLRRPYGPPFYRSISEDAKQEIVRRLLSEGPIIHFDKLSATKVEQIKATIRGFIPIAKHQQQLAGSGVRKHLLTRLPPSQYLFYFNSAVPTEQLLPDGTDTAHSPGDPFSQRLWAGGRIQFPQVAGLDLESRPGAALAEYVRDVRITGSEGQEKIFVKIERRVGTRLPGSDWEARGADAARLKRSSEDDIDGSLIVETRDLCFLREKEHSTSFERRHIAPPTDPDYFLSLTPTPALLFRFSALTFNAHAIHIDPEYTRKVYGFPNLLVHGPLSLTMMLEYMRQVLLAQPGSGFAPVITEINYRNLAPLFANEEMTICVKRKRGSKYATGLPGMPVSEAGDATAEGVTKPLAGENDSVTVMHNQSPEISPGHPPKPESRDSGIDIGKGFPIPTSGEEFEMRDVGAEPANYSEPNSKSSKTNVSNSKAASNAGEYPQEWEIWVQTGQGDAASLAVRGSIRVEEFDPKKQLPAVENQQQPKKYPKVQTGSDAKSSRSALTAEEVEMLKKVKAMLDKEEVNPIRKRTQPVLNEKNQNSKAQVDISAKPSTVPKPPLPIRYTNKASRRFSTRAGNASRLSLPSKKTPIRKVSMTFLRKVPHPSVNGMSLPRIEPPYSPGGEICDRIDTGVRFFANGRRVLRSATGRRLVRKSSSLTIRPHNPKWADKKRLTIDNTRLLQTQDGMKQKMVTTADEADLNMGGSMTSHLVGEPTSSHKNAPSAEGAFERTLRNMLAGM